jgi:hypothetical protein
MPALRRLLVGAAIFQSAAMACTLAVDTSDLDRGCPTGEKLCEGNCVRIDSPAYGCSPDVCEPCALKNAEPECHAGVCRVAACLQGFGCADCSRDLYVDPENCGACGNACARGSSCTGGSCTPQQ